MTYSRTTHRKSLKNNIYNTRTHKLKHIKNGNKRAKSMPHFKNALKGSRKKTNRHTMHTDYRNKLSRKNIRNNIRLHIGGDSADYENEFTFSYTPSGTGKTERTITVAEKRPARKFGKYIQKVLIVDDTTKNALVTDASAGGFTAKFERVSGTGTKDKYVITKIPFIFIRDILLASNVKSADGNDISSTISSNMKGAYSIGMGDAARYCYECY